MCDHTRHCGRKYFCRYCLQPFSTDEILKSHITDFFKINGEQKIKMRKKGEYLNSKIWKNK